MTKSDFDPTLDMVSFEAHKMAHENGFQLQLTEPDRLEFIRATNTPQGTVFTILNCGGAGAIGDPAEASWTAFKKRYGIDRSNGDLGVERTYVSTVHDDATLAEVLENLHLLPDPIEKEAGMDVYQSWSALKGQGLKVIEEGQMARDGAAQKLAEANGYILHHTGGGIFAFRRPHHEDSDAYFLITGGPDGDIHQSATDPVWMVGLYQVKEGGESWVFVDEGLTLAAAIERAPNIPLPEMLGNLPLEEVIDSWTELDDLAREISNPPRF